MCHVSYRSRMTMGQVELDKSRLRVPCHHSQFMKLSLIPMSSVDPMIPSMSSVGLKNKFPWFILFWLNFIKKVLYSFLLCIIVSFFFLFLSLSLSLSLSFFPLWWNYWLDIVRPVRAVATPLDSDGFLWNCANIMNWQTVWTLALITHHFKSGMKNDCF